jgi:hypothetical protein
LLKETQWKWDNWENQRARSVVWVFLDHQAQGDIISEIQEWLYPSTWILMSWCHGTSLLWFSNFLNKIFWKYWHSVKFLCINFFYLSLNDIIIILLNYTCLLRWLFCMLFFILWCVMIFSFHLLDIKRTSTNRICGDIK